MPAIQPARLKIHSAELAQHAMNPEEFCRAFHEFLDVYADRIYRSSLVGEPPPLMPSYHVAQPVMRAVLRELIPFADSYKDQALDLSDALWAEPWLEFKLLAAYLIGQISPEPPEMILNLILAWIGSTSEEQIIEVLILSGLEGVREEHQELYIQQIGAWLKSGESFEALLGLKSILPLLSEEEFEDFPTIFHLLTPLVHFASISLRSEILAVIEALAKRSPKETAHFLEHMIKGAGEDSMINWYVRHSLAHFPADSQIYLRAALRAKRELD